MDRQAVKQTPGDQDLQRGGLRDRINDSPVMRRIRSLYGPDYRNVRWASVITGVLGVLLAVLTPLLPIKQTTAELNWPQQGRVSDVSAPMVSFVPIDMNLSIPCSAAAELPADGGVLLSTIPSGGAGASAHGLFVKATDDRIQVTDRDIMLLDANRHALQSNPSCAITVAADTKGITAKLTGIPDSQMTPENGKFSAAIGDPNMRPQIVGLYTDLPDSTNAAGISFHSVIDTRFISTPTTLKFAAMVFGILMVICSLVCLGILDNRDGRRHRRLLPAGWWRVKPLDLVVIAVFGLWWLIGTNTSDDGYNYINGRVAQASGYVPNYFRYFGVPQDPMGWHMQFIGMMTRITDAQPFMRLPALLMGVLCWWLLSRAVLPRLGHAVRHSTAAYWAAAGVLLAIWLPFNNGLRPEGAIALGALLTWCSVDRAIATRRLLPLTFGILFAAFTLALAPNGLMAVLALVVGVRQIVKILVKRSKRDGLLPLLAPILAAGFAVLYEIFADQGIATDLVATKVSGAVGPNEKWWVEPIRYYYLLGPSQDGALSRRFGILLGLLAVAIVIAVMLKRRHPAGIARGPVWRLCATVPGTMFVLAFTPTKWSHHFGVFAGILAAVAGVAAAMGMPALMRRRRNRSFVIAACLYVAAIAFSGANNYWFAGAWGVPWWNQPPVLAGVKLYWLALAAALVFTALGLWQHFRDDYAGEDVATGPVWGKRLPFKASPIPIVAGLMIAFELLTMLKADVHQRHSWSWLNSNVSALKGDKCSLADRVIVEPDPNTGILSAARVAGQRNVSPGDTLAGTDAVGFSPNGVKPGTSIDPTINSDGSSAPGVTGSNDSDSTAAAGTGGAVATSSPGTTSAGTTSSPGATSSSGTVGGANAGVNGSTVQLPFGLNPKTTPVLGSYGAPGGQASLTSDWYAMNRRSSDTPLITMSVAGAVQAASAQGVRFGGPQVRLQFGAVDAAGNVTPVGFVDPYDATGGPFWRNLRFPMDKAPRNATVVRVVVKDTSGGSNDWVAITPPRMTPMVTLDQLVGHTDPVLIDWEAAFEFPCQRPMQYRYGLTEVPKWRIMPDTLGTYFNSQRWQSGKFGGPLGVTDSMLTSTLIPGYLKNDWGLDWGGLQRFTEIQPAPPAELEMGTEKRSGLWTPGPIRSVSY